MTRKRFKKLHMSIGYSRDEAEMLARLARMGDRKTKDKIAVHEGREYLMAGYDFWWCHIAISDSCLAAAIANYRKLVTHG